ncbi:hypothetical protein B0H13DRAFT_2343201 [Mycena leptocephala]|nr:hypothetical protein B0H13DRAFT_2343201 [Mycena leptocephala]
MSFLLIAPPYHTSQSHPRFTHTSTYLGFIVHVNDSWLFLFFDRLPCSVCSCTDSDTYAYLYPDEFSTIDLCGVLWEGGTLIHESSHFTKLALTEDYVYGQTAAKSLPKSNSAEAIEDADNYEYFAENKPAQS